MSGAGGRLLTHPPALAERVQFCLCTSDTLLRYASCKMRRIAAQVSQGRARQRSESPQPSRSQRRRTEPAEHSSRSRSPAAVRGRGRGRNATGRGRGRGRPPAPTPPPPGHESFGPTVNMFSVTSGILRQNCPSAWLEAHRRWARFCSSPWFAFSLELGSRRDHLHVQGVVKIRYPADKRSVKDLSDHLKGFLSSLVTTHVF